jgi:rubrerythrin
LIDTREELTYALHEAAELEHGLLIQYLFAAFSLKKHIDEGITGEQQELIRKWEKQILTVAREEMVHLGTVCNLLSAIGAAPHFTRPNFPQEATKYYPFSFTLSRFSDESLYRFIRFELPKGEKPPPPPQIRDSLLKKIDSQMLTVLFNVSPDPLEYEYVGELYRKVREGFDMIPEETLFIGPKTGQEDEKWSERISISQVVDRQTANNAIDLIIDSGEGSPGHRERSHYDTFLKMRAELNEQLQRHSDFDPSRLVVPNPRTRKFHRDAPATQGTTFIENESAKSVAELFNECYEIVLLMLSQLYSFGGESAQQRDTLRQSSRQFMTSVLRPIAEILTEMPAITTTENNSHNGNAGPTFELYGSLQISTQQTSRWIIVKEGLDAVANEARILSSMNQRLNFVSENLLLIKQNIEQTLALEEKL